MNTIKRNEHGHFPPGVSFNPGGRPKGAGELAQFIRRRAEGAEGHVLANFLWDLFQGKVCKDATASVRLEAVKELLNRGYGKAPELIQTIDLTGDHRAVLATLSREELLALFLSTPRPSGPSQAVIEGSQGAVSAEIKSLPAT